MKKLLLLIVLNSFVGSYCQAQTPIWENLFPDNRLFMTLNKTIDGNLIASGGKPITSQQATSNIAKYDTAGNLIWQRAGRMMYVGEHDFKTTPNGRFLFAGNIRRNQPGNYRDTFLQQLDENGDTTTTWVQTYIEPSWDYPTEMLLEENGDVLIAGLLLSPHHFTLRRTDSLGNTIWYKKYTTNGSMDGTRMLRNRNNNLVLLGSIIVPGVYPAHSYLIEVNLNGDSLKSKLLIMQDSSGREKPNRIYNNIIQTSDGGYAFGGIFTSNGFIAKTDSAFNLLWFYQMAPQHSSANEHIITKLIELADSTLLFMSGDNSAAAPGFYITRLSKEGDSISTTAIQGQLCPNGKVLPYNWKFLADSSVVICGLCVSNSQAYIGRWGNLNYPLPMGFYADTTTVSAPEALLPQKAMLGQSYPNPTTSLATIPYKLPKGVHTATMELHELVTGRSIGRYNLPVAEGPAELTVSLNNLPGGFYVYTLVIDSSPAGTKKMVLTR